MVKKLWVGIDWGTHSSKWWYTAEDTSENVFEPRNVDAVIDSTLHRHGQNLLLVREKTLTTRDLSIPRLKRCLIEYPLGPNFWEAIWEDSTGVSLGEASALSLAVILRDVFDSVQANGLEVVPGQTEIRICFSLPNWVGQETGELKARCQMFQACAAVVALLQDGGLETLPKVGMEVPIKGWHEGICRARKTPECQRVFGQFPPSFKDFG